MSGHKKRIHTHTTTKKKINQQKRVTGYPLFTVLGGGCYHQKNTLNTVISSDYTKYKNYFCIYGVYKNISKGHMCDIWKFPISVCVSSYHTLLVMVFLGILLIVECFSVVHVCDLQLLSVLCDFHLTLIECVLLFSFVCVFS